MGTVDNFIKKLIDQIVREVNPLKIVLFGSAVSRDISEVGDLDVIVIMPNGTHCRKTAQYLYKTLKNIGKPFDIIVVTPKILERHKDNIGLIYKTILAEGVELYAA